MKYCPNCGSKIPTGALFCGDCGTKLQLPVIPSLDEGKPVVRRRADSIGNDLTASYLVKTKKKVCQDDQAVKKIPSPPVIPAKSPVNPPPQALPQSKSQGQIPSSESLLKKMKSTPIKSIRKTERLPNPPLSREPVWGQPAPPPSPSSPEPVKKENSGGGRGDRGGGAKKEEAFIQSGGARYQIESYITRKNKSDELARNLDPVTCTCSIRCSEYQIKMRNNKPDYVVFKIDVSFHNVSWTCFRRWKQWMQLETIFIKEIKAYNRADGLPNIKKPKGDKRFSPEFLEQRRLGIDRFCRIMANSRAAIMSSRISATAFFRFIGPTQFGDIKPPHFVLPFQLE